ncbi:putative Products heat shock protein, partial [Candida albicans P60002]
ATEGAKTGADSTKK